MSAFKEGNAGEIKLFRERPYCAVVKIISTPDTEEMWKYDLKVLKVLEGKFEDGEEFSVSKSKECGQMAGWDLWDLDDSYAVDWMRRGGVSKADFMENKEQQ